MKNFYFSKYNFSRNSVITDGEYNIDIQKKIDRVDEHIYTVSLRTVISKDDMKLEIQADAEFTYCSDDYENEEAIINANTIAIMFPFVRSQVTLLTSQPGMAPIVLPPINTRKFN